MTLPPRMTIDVVGVTFMDGYPQNLYDLERAKMFYGDPKVRLERDPDNAVDANAVRVIAAVEHPSPHEGMIGHVPAALAARLAPSMDAGERWEGTVDDIRGSSVDRPGITIVVSRVQPTEHSTEMGSR